jgi:hypothetical protein
LEASQFASLPKGKPFGFAALNALFGREKPITDLFRFEPNMGEPIQSKCLANKTYLC